MSKSFISDPIDSNLNFSQLHVLRTLEINWFSKLIFNENQNIISVIVVNPANKTWYY